MEALVDQAQTLTLASRAFSTDCLGEFAQYITEYFDYDRVLPMVSETELGGTNPSARSPITRSYSWFYP